MMSNFVLLIPFHIIIYYYKTACFFQSSHLLIHVLISSVIGFVSLLCVFCTEYSVKSRINSVIINRWCQLLYPYCCKKSYKSSYTNTKFKENNYRIRK